jgi:hypothetical protein
MRRPTVSRRLFGRAARAKKHAGGCISAMHSSTACCFGKTVRTRAMRARFKMKRRAKPHGAVGGTRTPNLQVRSLLLYPIELRPHARVEPTVVSLRRERDSNPRYEFIPYNGLANRRLQPLGHLSNAYCAVSFSMVPYLSRPGRDTRTRATRSALPLCFYAPPRRRGSGAFVAGTAVIWRLSASALVPKE